MKENIIQSFKIMGLGMLAIFVVVIILITIVSLMSYVDGKSIERKRKAELEKEKNEISEKE